MTSADRSAHGRLARLWQGSNRIPLLAGICVCIWILAGLVSTFYLLSQVPDFVRSARMPRSAQRAAAWGPIDGFAETCAPHLIAHAQLLLVDPTGTTSPYVGYGQPSDVDLSDLGNLQYIVYPSTVTALGHVPVGWDPSASPADYIALWERTGYQPSTPSTQQALASAQEAESTLRAALPGAQVCTYTDAQSNRGVMYAVSPLARQALAASADGRFPTAPARTLANLPATAESWTAYPLTLLGLISLWVIGMLLLAAMPRLELPLRLTIAMALPLGCLAVALELLILSLLRLPWSTPWLALPWLVLTAAVLWHSRLALRQGVRWRAPWVVLASSWRQLGWDERAALGTLSALVVGLGIAAPLWLPYIDGLAFTYTKARAFFLDGSTIPYYTRAASMLYTVPAHPPLLALSVSWLYIFIGHVNEHTTLLLWPALYLSMVVAFYALARSVVSRRCALWCTVGMALIGTNSTQVLKPSYADMPLALYLLLGCGLLWYWAARGRRSLVVLPVAGVLLAAAALTKEEGLPAALLALAATPLLSVGRGSDGSPERSRWWLPQAGWWRAYLWAVPAFALSLSPWLLFQFAHPVPENTLYLKGWSVITLLHRLLIIAVDVSVRISTRWVAVLALIVAWAFVRWRSGRPLLPSVSGRAWFLATVVVAQLAVDCVAMDLTLNDVHLEVSWAAGRLLEQLIPLTFLGVVSLWPLIFGGQHKTTTGTTPPLGDRVASTIDAPALAAHQGRRAAVAQAEASGVRMRYWEEARRPHAARTQWKVDPTLEGEVWRRGEPSMVDNWFAAIKAITWPPLQPSSRSRRRQLGRLVITLGCLGVLALQVYQLLRAQACYSIQACNVDYRQFYGAAVAIRHGTDPYLPALAAQGTAQSTYVYPPLFALLLTPFTALPLPRALALWDVLNVAFLAGAIYALLRAASARPAVVLVLLGTALATFLGPVRSTLHWGQADLFILCSMATAFLAKSRNRPGLAGLLLALACVVKPTYLALVVFLLWKREFKFAVATVLAFLALFLVPFVWLGGRALHDEVTTLLFVSNQYATTLVNQAPMGVLQRLFTVNPYVRPLVVAPWLVTLLWLMVLAVVALLTVALTSPGRLRADPRSQLEVGLALLALFLTSPMSEEGHLTLLVVPLVALFAWLSDVGLETRRLRQIAGLMGVLVLVLLTPLHSLEASLWTRMASAHWPASDLYALLAAVYLYVLIALFALQLHALSVAADCSIPTAVRQVLGSPLRLAGQWLRDARAAWASVDVSGG